MYTNYFGLTEPPFSIAPNPQYLYMSKRHQEALAHLLYGVQAEGGGFILLTGEVGTGKTTLCRCLLEQIPMDVETAFVLNPRVSATELLATIADEFGFTCEADSSLKALTDSLNSYLLSQHKAGKRSVLIIDEAQNLSRDVLEQLRLLTNLETNEHKLLQIILLGQPELGETLKEQGLRQFSQRITARYHLEALDSAETREYITHRLNVAGGEPTLFSNRVTRRIHKLTGGIPRLINLVCDRSLLGTYAEDKRIISLAVVNKAATEVMGINPTGENWRVLSLAASLFIALTTGYWLMFTPTDSSTVQESLPGKREVAETVNQSPTMPNIQDMGKPREQPVLNGHDQINAAWHDLFVLWGAAFVDLETDPCELASNIGLMCMQRHADWQELLEIDRPVIVHLDNQYLTLSEVNKTKLTLFAGPDQFELSQADFLNRFNGNINLVWRMPPDYWAPLKRDDQGAAVDWLVMQMALIDGKSPPMETGFTFNSALENKVQDFQASVGLAPTGIVDPITWIHINSVKAVNIPTLRADSRS